MGLPHEQSWVIGTPAVRDGMVYVGTSDSSRFMALDAKTGRLRFNLDTGAYVFSSAALAGGLAYVGAHNGKLYAIDAKTGKLAWTFQTEAAKRDQLGPWDSLRREHGRQSVCAAVDARIGSHGSVCEHDVEPALQAIGTRVAPALRE